MENGKNEVANIYLLNCYRIDNNYQFYISMKNKKVRIEEIKIYLEKRGRPIEEANLNPYGGRYWIKEEWGERFSTSEEDKIIEKFTSLSKEE